jgi:hypothetical protein
MQSKEDVFLRALIDEGSPKAPKALKAAQFDSLNAGGG